MSRSTVADDPKRGGSGDDEKRRDLDYATPLLRAPWTAGRIARWLAGAYVSLTLIGVLALKLPGATIRGNELSFERCLFTAFNAATLTGFQQAVPLDQFGALGQFIVLLLMVAGTLFSLMIGGLALKRALKLAYSDAQVLYATAFTYLFSLGLGTALLLDTARGLGPSASQAASALGNCGLFLGTLPSVTDWRTHLALVPLAFVGGVGIPVLMELTDWIFRRQPMSKHARVTIVLLAGVYLFATIVLTPWGLRDDFGRWNLSGAVATGSWLSINARTLGMPIVSPASLSRAGQWLLIVLMLIGAAPAGSAGGLKVTSLFHAWRGTRRALRREPGLRVTGIAATWIATFALLFFVTLLCLIATLPEMAADRLVMLAASSVSNTGLSHEPITLTGGGLFVLDLAMLIGRAAPLLVLWWLAKTTDDTDVAVG